jgi:hypothetical protein
MPDAVTVDFSQATDNVIPVTAEWQDNCGLVTVAIDPPPNEPPEIQTSLSLPTELFGANEIALAPSGIWWKVAPGAWWALIGAEYSALYSPPEGCTVVSENPTSGVVERETTIPFKIDCATGMATGHRPPATGGAAPAAGTEAEPAQPVSSPAEFTG